MPGRVSFFLNDLEFAGGRLKIQHSHTDGVGDNLGVIVNEVIQSHFPGVDHDLGIGMAGDDPGGGDNDARSCGRQERIPVAIDIAQFQIAQAIFAGNVQKIFS